MRKQLAILAVSAIMFTGIGIAIGEDPKPAAGMPSMSPEQMKMQQEGMERWMKNMTPGAEHAELAKCAGKWTATMNVSMGPGAAGWFPMQGEAEMEMILGGRYLQQKFKATSPMGPVEGLGLVGFDKRKGEYQSVWLDTQGTGMNLSHGNEKMDEKTSFTVGEFYDPYMDRAGKTKEVWRMVDDNTMEFEIHVEQHDGSWWHMLKIEYKRKM